MKGDSMSTTTTKNTIDLQVVLLVLVVVHGIVAVVFGNILGDGGARDSIIVLNCLCAGYNFGRWLEIVR